MIACDICGRDAVVTLCVVDKIGERAICGVCWLLMFAEEKPLILKDEKR